MNGEELAASLGYDGIRPEELLSKVNAMMLFSTR